MPRPRLLPMLLLGTALLLGLTGCGAGDRGGKLEGWRKDVGTLRMGLTAGEENSVSLGRWRKFEAYLGGITGLPTQLYQASDYNGIIQALASGQVELGQMGPAAYAGADALVGAKVAPILMARSNDGTSGYYSAIAVRADSPYRSIADLKGKSIGYADFNSASGYIYPRWKLREQGIDPETHFGSSGISGGHVQGVLALDNGQFDAIAVVASGGTPETGFTAGALTQLARRGLIKREDFRIIWAEGPIPNSPIVMRTDTPQEFQDIARGALAALPYEDPTTWAETGQSPGTTYVAVTRDTYRDVIAIREAEIAERRTRPAAGDKAP